MMNLMKYFFLYYQFLSKNSKFYNSEHLFSEKFSVFIDNLKFIQEMNNVENNTFILGVNHFADISNDEWKNTYLGLNGTKSTVCDQYKSSGSSIPDHLDWRTKNVLSAVKDQGQCGSCWAFAATETLESAYALKTGDLEVLAPQELVDCDKQSFGCQGGYPDKALVYIENHGLELESDYPYTARDGSCKAKDTKYKLDKCFDVASNDEKLLQDALTHGPLVVLIEADQRIFQFYQSGIIPAKSCGQNLDHAVQLVGYGTENGMDYWLVRNSWGSGWGENGYVKLQRNSGVSGGTCGILLGPSGFSV